MKNKILASITALCAALVLVGGFSVTAYAQTPTEETDDSGVIVETEPQPLTPEGNMTLVDDIDGDAAEDKQFIVVKSKGGNYFYIIVDRAAEGENSVHFLNQVDESDLMAIIGEEQTEQPPAVCNCTEKCKAGEVNTACPVCSAAMNNCTGKEAEPEAPAEPTTKVCPFCCSEIPIKAIDDIGRATAEDVREALHQVIDPELGIDVIDLGLVYGIEIDELGRAIITMTLTTPACPLTDLIEDECASTLAGLVEEFRIDWTWDPRWTMERITPEGRDQLAALGFSFDNMPKY